MEICFLEDILSITNIICLVLQKDKKDFGAISRSVDVSISMLEEITQDCKSKLLKSFNTCGEIIEQLEEDFKMQSTVGQFYLKSVQHPFCNIFQYTGTIKLFIKIFMVWNHFITVCPNVKHDLCYLS